jgi:isopenicillin-N epimerase
MSSLADQFLLDPSVTFFNHGSFGATPRPVFESYQRWQLELERQPVQFIQRRLQTALREARAALAEYIHAGPDDVVYVSNATFGMNVVIRSLDLGPDDEVLTTDHEYGAVNAAWRFAAHFGGFRYINHPVPLPVTTHEAFVERLWEGVTPRTRVISISHITSPSALIFPVAELCARAREAGILTVIDGAHAPGQIPLDMQAIGADYYVGNCHKWLCAPKGAGFLHARPDAQRRLRPLVVSHGWDPSPDAPLRFVDYHQNQGTRDMAGFLAVPDAIRFQAEHDWDRVRAECHALASDAKRRILALSGVPAFQPEQPAWYAQMVAIPLPRVDVSGLYPWLLREHNIEVPIFKWGDQPLARLSIQAYNTPAQVDRFVEALREYTATAPAMAPATAASA